ncbi:MAG: MFS transporter [Propionibacteriaceae bacterium]
MVSVWGAELPVASTLVSEYAPSAVRGRMVVMLEAFWAVGWIAAAALGYFVVAPYSNGWRWALAVGIVPTLYVLVVRFGLPESVRFLESRGRHDEAERAVQIFETGSGVTPVMHTPPSPAAAPSRGSIWSAALRNRTAALWLVWFCVNFSYYGAFIWIPSLLHARGMTMTKSFGFTLIITLAQLPGYAVAAWLIEVWGRRSTLATFLVGSALSAAAFGWATTEPAVIAAGCALSFFNLGAWGALYAIGPEIYPTSVRGTAAGAAAAFGRIASIIAPISVPLLMKAGGAIFAFGVFGVAFLIAAIAAVTLPERKHLTMTE